MYRLVDLTLLGGQQIGVWSIDRKEIADAIDYAVDNGINLFYIADICENKLVSSLPTLLSI